MREIKYKIKHKEEECKECLYSGLCVKDLCEIEQSMQVPQNIEDVKELLHDLKIKHKLFYVNDKDYKWTKKDKVKILRAIVIKFKTKFNDDFTNYTITIDNKNHIIIDKREYEGIESVIIELSTMAQAWFIFTNIYKDVVPNNESLGVE